MSAALDCHQLRHYSDFETGSESGVSDLSYVHPYQPKKSVKRNKPGVDIVQRVPKRGARATRRQNNEAFLNSLSVIAETDLEEASKIAWPDSVSHCSAFTKLFESPSIRAVWDMFIALSEIEQTRLLSSFYDRSYSDNSDPELVEINDDYSDGDKPDSGERVRHERGKTHSRHSRRGGAHRKAKLHSGPEGDGCSGAGSFAAAATAMNASTNLPVYDNSAGNATQPELRDSLSLRFADLLSKPHNPLPINGRRKHSRRIRRAITSLDLCLIHRVESELRHWFARTLLSSTDSRESQTTYGKPGRWTPTRSLLNRIDSNSSSSAGYESSKSAHLLCLDAFERLLVHSVANYLGLCSYSTWSDKLGERQLWVEQRVGQPFCPPERTFVNLVECNLAS